MKPLHILVVDDDLRNLEAAREQFREHELVTAETYLQAVQRIDEKSLDVVLTDLFFPWSDGPKYPIHHRPDEATAPVAAGYPLSLYALGKGVKYVAIVSMANHHDGAMAATTDTFKRLWRSGDVQLAANYPVLRGAQNLWFMNASEYSPFTSRDPKTKDKTKDWRAVLDVLVGERKPFDHDAQVEMMTRR